MVARALVALLLAGCAGLTPAQEDSAAELRDFIARVTRVYQVPNVRLVIGSDAESIGGTYRRGMITVSTPVLFSRYRDSIIAHELGHYLLGHDEPLRGVTMLEQQREQEQRELDANVKAVEILVRAGRLPEEQALSLVYDGILGFHRSVTGGPGVVPWGHRPPCEEMADLLARFPAHRPWTASLECSGGAVSAIAGAPPAHAPGSVMAPAAPTSPLVERVYFSDRLPARMDGANPERLSGPPAVERFHPSRQRAVALVIALRPTAGAPRLTSRWYDEQGRERRVVDTVAAAAWQSHVTPMWMLRPYPGRWTARLVVGGEPAGQYAFVVASGVSAPRVSPPGGGITREADRALAPIAPPRLRAAVTGGRMTLSWDPVGLQILTTYRVRRLEGGGPVHVADVPADAARELARTGSYTLAIPGPLTRGTATYAVTAIDRDGNESAAARVSIDVK